jgi:preprotein translocase subunit YajC
MFWTSTAFAMGGQAAGSEGGAGGMMTILPLVLVFAVFYFLLIRPQQKRNKDHKAMLAALQPGEYVITASGIIARIKAIEGDIMTLDVDGTTMRVLRSAISLRCDANGRAIGGMPGKAQGR